MSRSHGHPSDSEASVPEDHGHHHDQGWRGLARYLMHGRRAWNSDVNRAVIDEADPRPDQTLVDIGAGFGPAVVLAARRGATVVAVEPTPSMRRTLTVRRVAQRERANIEVVSGTAEAQPIADDSADMVVSVNTMHHWSDAERAVTEIARVLKPGGRVILVDEAFDDPTHPLFDPKVDEQHHHQHDFLDIDPSHMAELLRSAGLVDAVGDNRRMGGAPVRYVAATQPSG